MAGNISGMTHKTIENTGAEMLKNYIDTSQSHSDGEIKLEYRTCQNGETLKIIPVFQLIH